MGQCLSCRHVFVGHPSSCPSCHIRFIGTQVGSLLPSYEEEARQRRQRQVLSYVFWVVLGLAFAGWMVYRGLVAPNQRGSALLEAVQRGDRVRSREILRQETNVDYRAWKWRPTPLMAAVMAGRADLVQILLQNGADVEAPLVDGFADVLTGKNERTSLQMAAVGGREDIVRLLLAGKANVDRIQIGSGKSALLLAAEGGHAEAVSALLSAGADAKLCDTEDKSALIIAAEKGHLSVVQALVDHGVDVNASCGGMPAVMVAAQYRHADVVAFLAAKLPASTQLPPLLAQPNPNPRPRSVAEETVRRYAARLRGDDVFVAPGIPQEKTLDALRWSKAAGERPLILLEGLGEHRLLVTDAALYLRNGWSMDRKSLAEINSAELRSALFGGTLFVNGVTTYWAYSDEDQRQRLDALARVLQDLSTAARTMTRPHPS